MSPDLLSDLRQFLCAHTASIGEVRAFVQGERDELLDDAYGDRNKLTFTDRNWVAKCDALLSRLSGNVQHVAGLIERLEAENQWQPIAEGPQPRNWMRHPGSFIVARFNQRTDKDGEPEGEAELIWAHVADLTHDGWHLGLRGIAGLHGYGSLPLIDATHWLPLPQPPEAARPTDARG